MTAKLLFAISQQNVNVEKKQTADHIIYNKQLLNIQRRRVKSRYTIENKKKASIMSCIN